MKIIRKNGATSNVLRVKILDTAQGNSAGKTGLGTNAGGLVTTTGLVISTICDVESTATVYTVAASHVQTIATLGTFAAPSASCCRFAEVDSTNHPGLYEIQLPDARFAVAGAKSLILTISGASGAAQCDAELQLDTFDVDSAAPSVNVGQWLGQAVVLDANNKPSVSANIKRSGTAQAGANTTITLDAGASAVDGSYVGCVVSTGNDVRTITSYVGATKVATVDRAWSTNPTGASTFVIHSASGDALNASLQPIAATVVDKSGYSLAAAPPTAAQVATAVWQDTTAGDFNVAGSIGLKYFTTNAAQSGDAYARIGAAGAGLTAVALASTGLNAVLVDGVALPLAFEYIAASTAGKLSGAGTNTEVFVGLDGATTRLTATVDASGNRSAITYG
jgi:hypothetical protein